MKKLFTLILTAFFVFFPFLPAQAIVIIPGCARSGDGGFCCALLLISNLSRFILSISGVIALGLFVLAGYYWITSMGNHSQVEKGKNIAIQTTIGLVIMALAWLIVNFIINSLIPENSDFEFYETGNQEWYQMCKDWDACTSKGEGWKCQSIQSCNLANPTPDGCDAAQNCERFLCPGDNNNVCCKP